MALQCGSDEVGTLDLGSVEIEDDGTGFAAGSGNGQAAESQ